MADDGGTKAVFAALAANIGIAVTKFVAYLLTGSSSMLAESIHSVADSGNQGLLLVGRDRSQREPTPEHPFGYGQERYLYGFLVAIVLFSLGGLFALYEAWHKFADPHPIESWKWVPVAVLLLGMVMEGSSLRTAVGQANPMRGDASWLQFIRRHKSPELPVILLEDFGALCGLTFALVGVGLTLLTDDGRWDAVGSAAIGVLLVVIAVGLALEIKSLLVGESATRGNVDAIRSALPGDGIDSVIHMRTMHLGPEELLVAAKIAVTPTDSAAEVARAIDAAEKRVRDAVPIARMIYLEPDLASSRGEHRKTDGEAGAPATPQAGPSSDG